MKTTNWLRTLLFMGVILIGLFGCSSAGSEYSPEQVINNALKEKGPIESYYAEAEMTISLGKDGNEHLLMKEWRTEDGKVRIEMQNIDGSGVAVSVNDGETFVTYDEEQHQAMIIDDPELISLNQQSPKEQAMHLLEMIQDTHELSSVGEEEVADRMAYHLKAKANEDGLLMGDQEIWIDKENWFILKTVTKSGDDLSEMVYTTIDFDATIPEDTFVFDLPDDVKIIDLDDAAQSSELTLAEAVEALDKEFYHFSEGDGIEIASITRTDLDGMDINRTEIDIEYTKDDLPLFSVGVFEAGELLSEDDMMPGDELVTIRDEEGYYTDMDGFRMVVWQEDGLNYSLMFIDPEYTLEDLQQLAVTMEFAK